MFTMPTLRPDVVCHASRSADPGANGVKKSPNFILQCARTPAAFYNFCHAALSKHGVLYNPDFDVSDLEKNDYLDFDTDEKGEFILNEHGHRIPSPQGYCKCYCDDLCLFAWYLQTLKNTNDSGDT
eukprot:COSAG01_NODE_22458_length_854_cov_197.940397_1_plen_126_part_00